MRVDIFIRTYSKDLPWLAYALKSIHKYVTGWDRIIVAIPEGEGHLLNHLCAEQVVAVPDLQDGYLGQQLTKMQAWKYTYADAILFWDSDVVATQPIDIRKEYFNTNCESPARIKLYKTRYSSMPGNPWQPIVAKALGFLPSWEYMRRMPLVYWRESLTDCEEYLVKTHGQSLGHYIRSQPFRSFSEFNVIGAFAAGHHPDRYEFIDTESVDMPPNKVDQMWSWGGITPEVMEKMRAYGLA